MATAKQRNNTIEYLLKRSGGRCEYCDVEFGFEDDAFEIEHFIPRKHGGSNKRYNLRASCRRCNAIKRDLLFDSMAEARDYIAIRVRAKERKF